MYLRQVARLAKSEGVEFFMHACTASSSGRRGAHLAPPPAGGGGATTRHRSRQFNSAGPTPVAAPPGAGRRAAQEQLDNGENESGRVPGFHDCTDGTETEARGHMNEE